MIGGCGWGRRIRLGCGLSCWLRVFQSLFWLRNNSVLQGEDYKGRRVHQNRDVWVIRLSEQDVSWPAPLECLDLAAVKRMIWGVGSGRNNVCGW